MAYTIEIQVRFRDADAYGHVNNAVFFTYMETARFSFLKEQFVNLMKSGITFLVAKSECEYKQPISLSDKVLIDVVTEKIGKSSFTLGYRIHDGNGKAYAYGKSVLVAYDTNKKSTIPIPDEFLRVLKTSVGSFT